MILPVYIYGHPVLRTSCEEVKQTYKNLNQLIENMFDTVENANGIGISAPQVGVSIKLFVIDLIPLSEEDPSVANIRKAFINPEILKQSGKIQPYNEGCLSIPGVREDINRKSEIKIKYFDQNFQEHITEIEGVFSRVFQHEYDHLNKTLFIDYLSPMKKNIVNRKLKAIQRGKFENNYPTVLKK